jgi:hypothetical protein
MQRNPGGQYTIMDKMGLDFVELILGTEEVLPLISRTMSVK